MTKYFIGKTFGTHALKGEVKVASYTNQEDKIFKVGSTMLIDDVKYTIATVRIHKNNYLISFQGYEDINLVNHLREKDIYITKDMLDLDDGEYLIAELIDMTVYENGEILGQVIEIERGGNCYYLRVAKDKEFLIPLIDEYILEIDTNNKKIVTKDASYLIF